MNNKLTRKIAGTEDFKKIQAFMHGDEGVKLDARIKKMLVRLKYCNEMIDKHGPDREKIIRILERMYEVSYQTARNDYYSTMRLFHADVKAGTIDM